MINMRDSTDLVLTFALLLLCSVFSLSTLVSYERNITMLEESVCDKQSTIDSLTNVIDSLEHKLNTFNIKSLKIYLMQLYLLRVVITIQHIALVKML